MRLLEFVNLTYTYDGQQPLLRGVSGQLERGKLYGILGPSGCGKTTLLSLLGGLDTSCSRGRTSRRQAWGSTGAAMWPLSFNPTT